MDTLFAELCGLASGSISVKTGKVKVGKAKTAVAGSVKGRKADPRITERNERRAAINGLRNEWFSLVHSEGLTSEDEIRLNALNEVFKPHHGYATHKRRSVGGVAIDSMRQPLEILGKVKPTTETYTDPSTGIICPALPFGQSCQDFALSYRLAKTSQSPSKPVVIDTGNGWGNRPESSRYAVVAYRGNETTKTYSSLRSWLESKPDAIGIDDIGCVSCGLPGSDPLPLPEVKPVAVDRRFGVPLPRPVAIPEVKVYRVKGQPEVKPVDLATRLPIKTYSQADYSPIRNPSISRGMLRKELRLTEVLEAILQSLPTAQFHAGVQPVWYPRSTAVGQPWGDLHTKTEVLQSVVAYPDTSVARSIREYPLTYCRSSIALVAVKEVFPPCFDTSGNAVLLRLTFPIPEVKPVDEDCEKLPVKPLLFEVLQDLSQPAMIPEVTTGLIRRIPKPEVKATGFATDFRLTAGLYDELVDRQPQAIKAMVGKGKKTIVKPVVKTEVLRLCRKRWEGDCSQDLDRLWKVLLEVW